MEAGGGGFASWSAENNDGGGGGGSGYIGNSSLINKVMYGYNVPASTDENTKTISTTEISASATENKAKIGNGFARITFIE